MKRTIEIDTNQDTTQNPRVKAAIYLSCIAGVCTILVLILVSKNLILILASCGLVFIVVLNLNRLRTRFR